MRPARLLSVAALVTCLTLAGPAVADADLDSPDATFGAVNVLASAATKVPTAPLSGRHGIAIYNGGPYTIYCGWTSAVATTTGFPVLTGGSLSVDVSYSASTSGKAFLWCIAATADQSSPANTRYLEVK